MFEEQFPMFLDFITENNLNFRTRTDLARAFSSAFKLDFTTAYSTIGDMIKSGDLIIEGHDKLATPAALGLRKGILIGNSRGFAFCRFLDDSDIPDVFIPPTALKTALHNDVVLVKVRTNGDKTEGEVIKIVERSKTNIVGTIDIVNKEIAFIKPDDTHYYRDIVVRNAKKFAVKNGDKVVCRVVRFNSGQKNPEGELTEVLGLNGDPKIEMLAIIRENNLYDTFEAATMAEARKLFR